jgi:hypothetical protein
MVKEAASQVKLRLRLKWHSLKQLEKISNERRACQRSICQGVGKERANVVRLKLETVTLAYVFFLIRLREAGTFPGELAV